jgi:hypothetical protein
MPRTHSETPTGDRDPADPVAAGHLLLLHRARQRPDRPPPLAGRDARWSCCGQEMRPSVTSGETGGSSGNLRSTIRLPFRSRQRRRPLGRAVPVGSSSSSTPAARTNSALCESVGPAATRRPLRTSVKNYTVVPDPTPSTMPGGTSSRARLAAARFKSVRSCSANCVTARCPRAGPRVSIRRIASSLVRQTDIHPLEDV